MPIHPRDCSLVTHQNKPHYRVSLWCTPFYPFLISQKQALCPQRIDHAYLFFHPHNSFHQLLFLQKNTGMIQGPFYGLSLLSGDDNNKPRFRLFMRILIFIKNPSETPTKKYVIFYINQRPFLKP